MLGRFRKLKTIIRDYIKIIKERDRTHQIQQRQREVFELSQVQKQIQELRSQVAQLKADIYS
jgi:hypothetical protein